MADLLLKFVQYVAPVLTPRTNTGEINFDVIPHYIDHLISTGVQGKFSTFKSMLFTGSKFRLLLIDIPPNMKMCTPYTVF